MKIHAQLLSSHANKQRSKHHRSPPVSEVIKQYGTKTRIIFFWERGPMAVPGRMTIDCYEQLHRSIYKPMLVSGSRCHLTHFSSLMIHGPKIRTVIRR